MKKIAILLAMILCVVPVLTACGGVGGAEKAVKNYLEARYVDFDKEAFFASSVLYNKDMLKELLDEDDYKAVTYDGWRDTIENSIKNYKEYAEDAEDYELNYEIYASRVIEKDSDEFDAILAQVSFNVSGEGYGEELLIKDTDLEDLVEEMAIVRYIGEQNYVNRKDEERIETVGSSLLCLNIDGDWYVYGYADYSTHYASDDEDGSLKTWLD